MCRIAWSYAGAMLYWESLFIWDLEGVKHTM